MPDFSSWTTWAGIALIVFTLLGQYIFSGVRAGVSRLSSGAVDSDADDFMAAKRLRERFVRNKCPEGIAAVDLCVQHFFHEGE